MLTVLNNIVVGVQSWCFSGMAGNISVINALKELGIDRLEICGVHVDVNTTDQADKVLELYKNNGITFTSYGIDNYPNDEVKLRKKFEFAKKAGIKVLGADPDPDAYDLIDKLCKEYGIKIAIHNHGRKHRYGSAKQLAEAFGKSTDNIGLCIDTGWALDSRDDPVSMIRTFSDRLYGIHVKDFNFDKDNPKEAFLGTGILKLKEVITALREVDFKGYMTIEYEGDFVNPVPGIRKCIDELKKYA